MTTSEPQLAPPPRRRGPAKPITGLSIERIIGRSVAILSVVFGAQSLPFAIAQSKFLIQPFGLVVTSVLFAALAATAVAGFTGRHVAAITSVVPIVFVVMLATWPMSVRDPAVVQSAPPWLWFLCNIALAAAVVAFSPWVAAIYLVLVPVVFAAIELTPAGGSASIGRAVMDSAFAGLLGAAILILAVLLRRAADDVDGAQNGAVSRYAEAVREHAMETERAEVDSIVHDGVLTTLLSAGRAFSPRERSLAVAMARSSMDRLATALESPVSGNGVVPLASVRDRLLRGLDELDPLASITPPDWAESLELKADIAQSLGDAAVQALVNSCQHAGDGASRSVTVKAEDGVAVIRIADDGVGFDPAVHTDRLGVRLSILHRIRAIGGLADIESAPGRGTVITLRWPHFAPEALE